ncbi:hypothetical protein KCU85_g393, partial [Aureobasidium melanogenum]
MLTDADAAPTTLCFSLKEKNETKEIYVAENKPMHAFLPSRSQKISCDCYPRALVADCVWSDESLLLRLLQRTTILQLLDGPKKSAGILRRTLLHGRYAESNGYCGELRRRALQADTANLNNEADYVKQHEDLRQPARTDESVVLVGIQSNDDSAECHVHGCRKKDWRRKATVQASNLHDTTNDHRDEETLASCSTWCICVQNQMIGIDIGWGESHVVQMRKCNQNSIECYGKHQVRMVPYGTKGLAKIRTPPVSSSSHLLFLYALNDTVRCNKHPRT